MANEGISEKNITIPVTTIFKPTYAQDSYKLPEAALKFFSQKGINIGRCLGEGSFAAAYEGRYTAKATLPHGCEKYLGKEFAVKVHHIGYHPYIPGAPNKEKIGRETLNEIQFSKRADIVHPNLIGFHFTCEYPEKSTTVCDHVFMFMDKAMFPLQDLMNCLIRMRATVPVSIGLRWMRDLYSGLIHLHSLGIAHNDLNSYNVFVFGDSGQQIGNDFRFKNIDLKIADFGKSVDTSKSKPEEKTKLMEKDIEKVCLMFIALSDRIAFSESVRFNCVDLIHQCYQKKISFEELLKSQTFTKLPLSGEDWTIFIAQSL